MIDRLLSSRPGRRPLHGEGEGGAHTIVHRKALDLTAAPVDVLLRARGEDRLVALIGSWRAGEAVVAWDPLKAVQEPFDDIECGRGDPSDSSFGGGWIGLWGYQLGGDRRRESSPLPTPVPQPPCRAAFYDRVLRRIDGTWWFEHLRGLVGPDEEARRATSFLSVLDHTSSPRPFATSPFTMTPSPQRHRVAVRQALEHIAAGDIFQVNLTARLSSTLDGDPLDLFCQGVERLEPAYAAYISDSAGAVASFSPELFLQRVGNNVLTSPIKGTASLEADPAVLTASAKDRAENVMIVDLMRNDLGRVAVPGSVVTPALVRLERHAVWHLVSDVSATLRPEVTDSDLLRATFPPGSVTGAPKVRAMQIIDELESSSREAYTGAIGYVSPCAGLELNVAIRTFEIGQGRVWLGVGGGIVADSTPDAEYAECLVKAEPLIEAIGGRLADDLSVPHADRQAAIPSSPTWRHRPDPRDGVFETLLVRDGVPIELSEHLDRLFATCRSLYDGAVPMHVGEIVRRRAGVLQGTHRLRLDIRPGAEGLGVTLTTSELTQRSETTTLIPRVVPGGIGPHKWSDRRVLDGARNGCEGLLILDHDGAVLETDTGSLFAVFDEGVRTPPLDGRILPGVTRQRAMAILHQDALPVREAPISIADLLTASEVFTTNSLRGIVSVTGIRGVGRLQIGPVAARLRARFDGTAAPSATPRLSLPPALAHGPRHVVVIDNYDSFVYNLVQYLGELGASVNVVRNDRVKVEELVRQRLRGDFTHVLISPGPGGPSSAGVSVESVRRLGATTPILGVCLGHQAIVEAYGGSVRRAHRAVHGQPAIIHHDGLGVHAGQVGPRSVGRYHSLVLEEATLPRDLIITSRTPSGVAMGVRHTRHQVEGVQWHPESILTTDGHAILNNFLSWDPTALDETQAL